MNLREEDYLIDKFNNENIKKLSKQQHVGRNVYVYDLQPLSFIRFKNLKYCNLYEVFNLQDYDKYVQNSIESIIMERTLNIVLSKKSLDHYINDISYYIDLLSDYVYDDWRFYLTVDYENTKVIEALKKYINLFYNTLNIILAGSIDINHNLKDTNVKDWNKAFSILDYVINVVTKSYRLEIARYYYYDKEKQNAHPGV